MEKILILFPIILLILTLTSAEVRINEIESNPQGPDSGNEWIELYCDEELSLEGWRIINNDGDIIELTQTIKGCTAITLEKQWLDNKDEKIYLYKGDELIHETETFQDSQNNDKTIQFCDDEWIYTESTKDVKNDCEEEPKEEISFETQEDSHIEQSPENPKENIKQTKPPPKTPQTKNPPIKLNNQETQSIKTNKVLYESKKEYIKKYAIYAFAFFLLILCILLIFDKL